MAYGYTSISAAPVGDADGYVVSVDMKVAEQDGESAIDTVDQGKFEEALKKAAGQ